MCSSYNTAQSNTVYGSAESGIHVDDTCGSGTGTNNSVTKNTINEACAGILLGTGGGNTTAPNTFFNVANTTLAGDTCTPPMDMVKKSMGKHASLRPSPYIPVRK